MQEKALTCVIDSKPGVAEVDEKINPPSHFNDF